MKPRSPIEMMVDKACGFDREAAERAPKKPQVTMRCPKCALEKVVDMDPTDPPGTAVVEVHCPECTGGDFSQCDYFDAKGEQIFLTGDEERNQA